MRPFDLFFQLNSRIDGPTNSPTFLYRCNSTFPDEIHDEKTSFLDFENNWLWTDGRTDPLIEMRGRI